MIFGKSSEEIPSHEHSDAEESSNVKGMSHSSIEIEVRHYFSEAEQITKFKDFVYHVAYLIQVSMNACPKFTKALAGLSSNIFKIFPGYEYQLNEILSVIYMQCRNIIAKYKRDSKKNGKKNEPLEIKLSEMLKVVKKLKVIYFPFELSVGKRNSLLEEICEVYFTNNRVCEGVMFDEKHISYMNELHYSDKRQKLLPYLLILKNHLATMSLESIAQYIIKNSHIENIKGRIELTVDTSTYKRSLIQFEDNEFDKIMKNCQEEVESAKKLIGACYKVINIASKVIEIFGEKNLKIFVMIAYEILFAAEDKHHFESSVCFLEQILKFLSHEEGDKSQMDKKESENLYYEPFTIFINSLKELFNHGLKKPTRKAIILKAFDSIIPNLQSILTWLPLLVKPTNSDINLTLTNIPQESQTNIPQETATRISDENKNQNNESWVRVDDSCLTESDEMFIDGKEIFQKKLELYNQVIQIFNHEVETSGNIFDKITRDQVSACTLAISFDEKFKLYELKPYEFWKRLGEIIASSQQCYQFCGYPNILSIIFDFNIQSFAGWLGNALHDATSKSKEKSEGFRVGLKKSILDNSSNDDEENKSCNSDSTTH